jgi:transposase-like protein
MMRKAVESRRWSMTSPPEKKRERDLLKRLKGRGQMEKIEKSKVERPGIEDKKGRKGSGYTAEQKCRAVLSVWTERRKPVEVCQELGVAWSVLSQWQERAMEGMFLALQPRIPMIEKTVALNSRLAVLLERKSKRGGMKGLERRLARLQSKTRLSEGSPVKQGELQEIAPEKKV